MGSWLMGSWLMELDHSSYRMSIGFLSIDDTYQNLSIDAFDLLKALISWMKRGIFMQCTAAQ